MRSLAEWQAMEPPLCENCGTPKRLRSHFSKKYGYRRYYFRCKPCQQEAERGEKLARGRVWDALLQRRITRQPCERCGATERVQAHHDDYSKPLEVTWLCPLHHAERHRRAAA